MKYENFKKAEIIKDEIDRFQRIVDQIEKVSELQLTIGGDKRDYFFRVDIQKSNLNGIELMFVNKAVLQCKINIRELKEELEKL